MRWWSGILGGLACTAIITAVVSVVFPPKHDDTDPVNGRSGMVLHTDAKTGCQYLSSGFLGGITPRLDAAGRHICGVRP